MMSGMPSLTILSEEQKFNGDNLLQWKTNITRLLGLKGLLGYIDGKILKPTKTEPPTAQPTTSSSEQTPAVVQAPTPTPIYSSTPTLDELIFQDQVVREHITLNCVDIAGLGINTSGMAKEAWESILA